MSRYDEFVSTDELSADAIQNEVARILASDKFARSKRLRSLLQFTVTQTLKGNAETLKEYVIGTEVLKKPDSYDPRSDSLVRVLASRLRVKLREYYTNGGSEDPLVIEFPKGKYVPRFQRREQLQTEIEKKLKGRNAYSRGRYLAAKLTREALEESVDHFRQAIEADPGWPAAANELATAYTWQALLGYRRAREVWPLAREAAEAALQMDEMSAEPYLCLGLDKALFEWRWFEAELHFNRAIERDPYSGAGHMWRAFACRIPMGRLAAAREEMARARELAHPAFFEEACVLAHYFFEQYDGVLHHTEHLAHAEPSTNWLPWLRSAALAAAGQIQAALTLLTELYFVTPQDSRIASMLGYVYGLAGQRDKAQAVLEILQEQRDQGAWVPNFDFALVHTGIGNRNEALALLQESLKEREPWLVFLTVDPRLGSLRTIPKFAALVRRIFLTEAERSVSHETLTGETLSAS